MIIILSQVKDTDTESVILALEEAMMPPLHLNIKDFSKEFKSLNADELLFINDLDPLLAKERQALMECLVTKYTGDSLSVIPSCEFGCTTGAYQVGKICDRCFTEVLQPTERKLDSTIWMKAPDCTPGFINPVMYLMLVKLFGGKSPIVHEVIHLNVIDWLLRIPVKNAVSLKYKHSPLLDKYTDLGFKRGLNNFYDQLDLFIENAFTPKLYGTTSEQKSKERRERAKQWLIENRDKLFCRYLPLPSRVTFVREDVEKTAYVDKNVQLCIDAVNTMLNIKLLERKADPDKPRATARLHRQIEDRTALASSQLAKFYYDYVTKTLSKKSGTIRKHIFGTRSNFTFRSVITSITEPYETDEDTGEKVWHHYQDVHIPWGVGLNIFSLHITNKLLKMGYTPIQANRLIVDHVNVYNPLLDKLMKEVIKEHPSKKFPILLNRNPTLLIQSIQQLYITKVKKDPNIRSMSLSLLVLAGFNADFDGDELNGLLITDLKLYEKLKKSFAPSNGIFDMHTPGKIGKVLTLPRPTTSTISHWFNEPFKEAS